MLTAEYGTASNIKSRVNRSVRAFIEITAVQAVSSHEAPLTRLQSVRFIGYHVYPAEAQALQSRYVLLCHVMLETPLNTCSPRNRPLRFRRDGSK